MDPAVLNYLQSQQMNNQQPEQRMQEAPSNPFDIGISKAIESARQSLGLTEKQQDKALRSSMLSFANNIAQQPRQRGFFNNVGTVGRALSPAISTYDQEESAGLHENNALANQILAHQAREQAAREQAEHRAWQREHAQAQLAETQRAHNLMDNFRRQSLESRQQKPEEGTIVEFEGHPFRKLDKVEQRQANAFEKKAGNTYLAFKEVNKSWEELEKLTEGNTFRPVGGYSGIANPVKDFYGRYAGNKELKQETALRKTFAAQLGNLNTVLEGVKAGGGKLGQGMYDRLKPNFPDLNHDDYETIKSKMDAINKEIDIYYKAGKASAKYGINIGPNDLDELMNAYAEGHEQTREMPENVLMQDAEGNQYEIPSDAVEEALSDGLMVVR